MNKAKILPGFRDILPAEMKMRQKVISTIQNVYELHGFVPLATPAIESRDILLRYGDEANKQIYLFEDLDGNKVGLRFDLTVSLARVVATYKDLPRPFKRYQIQPVWRYDKPDPGRFREFLQFDIDIAGTESVLADAEIILTMYEAMKALKLPDFCVKVNNRKILNGLIAFADINPDKTSQVLRVIDKLDKQGLEAVKQELQEGRVDVSGDVIKGVGLKKSQVDRIEQFLLLPQQTPRQAIDSVSELLKGIKIAEEGIQELKQIYEYLSALDVPEEKVRIDLSIVRGLDYYTGPIYEAILPGLKRYGSIMGGGRFDNLIEQFTGQKIPATGASIGVDRLVFCMKELGMFETRNSTADVLVTVMVKDKITEYQKIANTLRQAGIKTEVYMGEYANIKTQLKYADEQGIPIAVIIGPDEFSNNTVCIKDMNVIKTTKVEIKDRAEWLKARVGQKTVPVEKLVEEIKLLLGGNYGS